MVNRYFHFFVLSYQFFRIATSLFHTTRNVLYVGNSSLSCWIMFYGSVRLPYSSQQKINHQKFALLMLSHFKCTFLYKKCCTLIQIPIVSIELCNRSVPNKRLLKIVCVTSINVHIILKTMKYGVCYNSAMEFEDHYYAICTWHKEMLSANETN